MGGCTGRRFCRPLRGWNRVGSSSRAHALRYGTGALDGARPVKRFNEETTCASIFERGYATPKLICATATAAFPWGLRICAGKGRPKHCSQTLHEIRLPTGSPRARRLPEPLAHSHLRIARLQHVLPLRSLTKFRGFVACPETPETPKRRNETCPRNETQYTIRYSPISARR